MNIKRKNIKQKMVILGAFVAGILISTYLKTFDSSKVYISLDEKKKLENKIELSKNNIEKLEKTKSDLQEYVKKYEEVLEDDNKSINDLLEEELKKIKELSGYTDIKGEGLIVTIKDSEKEVTSGENPNDFIVHDIDVLKIINDLKKSGAKALSINGERLLPTSRIKCSGATITVNDITYGQPFVIKAIGEADSLMASIISPQSYANLLKDGYGIYVKAQEKNDIVINSYEKSR
ncbi:DUF881 domain-containing protein [Clostridium sp. CCUG 7971]|uniref:DUF881 domain-containing protein n=1 Tax=Clostridium sp. CCUG 7971 TaxID=2811414 RepID=UPI002570B1E6|nr:DUF881 domain-containing protein [Clostridium sp. CCUG 7971]